MLVAETLDLATFVLLAGNGSLMLPIDVGLGISLENAVGVQQQLWREFFILMVDGWCKPQAAQDGTTEDVAACRTVNVVILHQFCSCYEV